jgi:hypothetical protein
VLNCRVMKYVFNRYVAAIAVIILLATGVLSLYAYLHRPDEAEWNYKHVQRIDRGKSDFTFDAFGDNKNSVSTFKELIGDVNRDGSSFAIDVGDLVFDGKMDKFAFFMDQARTFTKPLLTAIGNHETYANGRGNYFKIFGGFYYSFTVGRNYFIVLDDANEKNLDDWQMVWLKSELARSQAYRNRFVFMHVPLYDDRTSGSSEHGLQDRGFARRLNDLFDASGVTMLFASHIHEYASGTWGRTPFIITGGAGAELLGRDTSRYFYHYVRVHVSDSGLSYEVVHLKTPTGFGRLVHDTWLYVYAFIVIDYNDIIAYVVGFYLVLFLLYELEKRTGWYSALRKGRMDKKGLIGEKPEE